MAIVTDQTITVHGVSIGISKPIQTLIANGDFTYAELSKFAIVGRYDFVNDVAGVYAPDNYSYMAGTASVIEALEKYPVINDPTAPNWDSKKYIYKGKGARNADNYGKMVLVYNMVSSAKDINKNFNDSNTACIVTEFNPRLIKMMCNCTSSTITANVGETGTYTYYDLEASINFVWMDDDTSAPFRCLCIQNFEDAVYFTFPLYDGVFNANQSISGVRDSMYVNIGTLIDDYTQTGSKLLSVWADGGIDDFLNGANYGSNWTGVNKLDSERGKKIIRGSYDWYYAAADFYINPSDLDTALKQLAACGFYFEANGTVYKPITTDGIVTDYTADLSKNGQWDMINDVSGNTIPDKPSGGGGGGGGYDDDPWHGASFSGVSVGGIGAFAKCYYMTSTELANLRSWMGSINVPEGFNPMEQIIGLSQVPVALSGDAPETVQFVNSSAVYDPGVTTRVVDSGVSTQQSMGTPIKYSLGSVDITRRMQQRGEPYLDYSCQIELYLPLIGVFSLDTQAVMGRTINAEAVLDPTSGTLAAYAWVEKDGQKLPIAYGSTSIGVDLPITAQQYSVAKAALKQANAQLATSLLSSALTLMASASASGKAAAYGNGRATAASGMRSAAEGYNSFTQAASIAASQTMVSQTGNVFGSFMDWGRTVRQLSYGNNTAISGSFGGSSAQWTYPFTAYVKIIRPRFEKPSNYKHTQGVPCVQAKTVGSCTGFIQCIGPDVSGITRATDLERQAIQAALSNGVYAGGGQ